MNDRQPFSPGVRRKALLIGGTVGTGIIVMLLLGVLMVVPAFPLRADIPSRDTAEVVQQVSPRQIDMYCPARMALADAASYGDEEFHASVGDLASGERFAAFGSVFHSQVSELQDADAVDALVLAGAGNDTAGTSVLTAARDQADSPVLFDTRVLKADPGTGVTGAVASWATEGDIPGMAASGCIETRLVQSFLVPSTTTGNTQQLLVANTSDKPTTVAIRILDSEGHEVAQATNSTVAVGANDQASVMLQAAAPDRNGLFVTVTSHGTPVAAVIRSISIDGLTPKGNDYIMPVQETGTEQAMPLPGEDDDVTVLVHADQDTKVEFSWMTDHGLVKAKDIRLAAGNMSVVGLDGRPDDASALYAQSESPCAMAARVEADGNDGHADYAFVQGSVAHAQSAMAVAPGTAAAVSMANMASRAVSVNLQGYGEDGAPTGSRQLDIDASSSVRVDLESIGKGTVTVATGYDGADLVWGGFLTNAGVAQASVPAVAYVPSSALALGERTVSARQDSSIVR